MHRALRPARRMSAHRQPQTARHQPPRFHLPDSVSQGVRRARTRRRHQNGRQQLVHGHGAQLSTLQVQRSQDHHGEHQKGDAVHQDLDSTFGHRHRRSSNDHLDDDAFFFSPNVSELIGRRY